VPLTASLLEQRSYEELRDELVERIPVHDPEWTDFSQSDPGVIVLQLFAFLTESILFRVGAFVAGVAALAWLLRRWRRRHRAQYFDGRLLDAGDLRDEQQYLESQESLLNKALRPTDDGDDDDG
jgi:hypothetical protein